MILPVEASLDPRLLAATRGWGGSSLVQSVIRTRGLTWLISFQQPYISGVNKISLLLRVNYFKFTRLAF